jgi:hypothetical protein
MLFEIVDDEPDEALAEPIPQCVILMQNCGAVMAISHQEGIHTGDVAKALEGREALLT